MATKKLAKEKLLAVLDEILEHEMAGVVRYTHYAFMTFGYTRIPVAGWFQENADESLLHARLAGEHIATLGGHPSAKVGKVSTGHKHDIDSMLREALIHEMAAIDAYARLLALVEGRDVALEEYARSQIATETEDVTEIEKMLRRPGS